MKEIRYGLWLIALGIIVFCVGQLIADEPGDVRGAWFIYHWSSGKFGYEPFLKIIHPQDGAMDDEGRSFVWGFRPWNLEPPDEKGLTPPVNISSEEFVPCDGKAHLVTIHHPSDPNRKVERMIKPPCEELWK